MTDSPAGPPEPFDVEALLSPHAAALAPPTALSPLRYDLNAGVPDRDSLPASALAEAAGRCLEADPAGALTYGGAAGYEPLRAWIAQRNAAETAVALSADHVTLTSGSAQAIDNIAATFLARGDAVITGAPTYPGAIRAFRARGARIIDVPQDEDGLRIDAVDAALASEQRGGAKPKLIYVIANYDNPSGATLPIERREQLVAVASRHSVLLLEDDAYTGIDLDGPPPPALFGIAGGQGVIRVGTFSKTIATGLRVAWALAAPEIVARLNFMRFDNGASPFVQRTVHAYLEAGHFDSHVAALRALYRERRDAAAAALVEHCEPYVRFRTPAGGFFHWLQLADGLDAGVVCEAAARLGVAVTPGANYFAHDGGRDRLRLVYSALRPTELRDAIALLGEAMAEVATTAAVASPQPGT